MRRAVILDPKMRPQTTQLPAPELFVSAPLADDKRWLLTQRVVASRHFSRSLLLSRFLLYIVSETLEGRAELVTEHAIGVRVFDRPASYRTVEDNIVRNYARQLRRRLADYFANEGAGDDYRIHIPLGRYVPTFRPATDEQPPSPTPTLAAPTQVPSQPAVPAPRPRSWILATAGVALYSCALIAAAWFVSAWAHTPHRAPRVTDPLWQAILQSPETTYIVPSDSGFNLVEDIRRQALPLADYINGSYLGLPLPALDPHTANDLRSQQYTSYTGMQVILALERLPQFDPRRDVVRFPRALHLDDLKNSNVILLGSQDSNPWASLAETIANFRIVDQQGMESARIINLTPRPGEEPFYVSHWNEPSHQTYALIQYLPNLGGNAHFLLLQGLDVAGTQAAGEVLFHPESIAPVLRRALRPDGSMRPFEVLLRTTSIASNSAGAHVVASRVY